jgi:hypothetical protein
VSKHVRPCRLKFAGIHCVQRARHLDDGVQVDVPAISISTSGRLYMHMAVTSCHNGAYKAPTEEPCPRISKNLMATGGVKRRNGQRKQREAIGSGSRDNATAHPPLKAFSILDRGLA